MAKLRLFWWAPTKSLSLAAPELRESSMAWIRLAFETGRLGRNFGDELSPFVLEAATGRAVEWASPKRAEVVGIGSVLDLYAYHATGASIWGSGLRNKPAEAKGLLIADRLGPILAVRGPLTLGSLGGEPNVALGDPGVLAATLGVANRSTRQKKITVIPHYRAWASIAARSELERAKRLGYVIAPPSLAPLDIIDRIRNASFVLTSSLHGLIISHSLGIPVQLVSFAGSTRQEPDYKYMDYAGSVGYEISRISFALAISGDSLNTMIESAESLAPQILKRTEVLAEGLHEAGKALG